MIVILTGAPGAGKGTQADLLSTRKKFRKLSTGDALRKHVKLGTGIGKIAGAVMEKGELVSDEILLEILKEELNGLGSEEVVLLDGYPRNVAQAEALERCDGAHRIGLVLHLEVSRQDLLLRLSGRRICGSCGATFHIVDHPPRNDGTCDKCGGELRQRPDDKTESVSKRLDIYEMSTKPVLQFYRDRGLCVTVDGSGAMEDIYSRLEAHIARL